MIENDQEMIENGQKSHGALIMGPKGALIIIMIIMKIILIILIIIILIILIIFIILIISVILMRKKGPGG